LTPPLAILGNYHTRKLKGENGDATTPDPESSWPGWRDARHGAMLPRPGRRHGAAPKGQFTVKIKSFQDFPSHRILWHMHETLNIDKNKN